MSGALLDAIEAVMAEQWSGTKAQMSALTQIVTEAKRLVDDLAAAEAAQPTQERKPLTDEQIDAIALTHTSTDATTTDGFRAIVRAIEAAHGITKQCP